jgi:metallo-beta-lactamase class B
MRRILSCLILALLTGATATFEIPSEWTRPAKPFRIVGPIYYVGTEGIAVYLVETRKGLILLDGGLEENVPAIESNIVQLGFRLRDVKLLLSSHAHFDHVAGLARLKRDTGASFAASVGDRAALESGSPPSEISYGIFRFPPVKVDRVLADGQPLHLGNIVMTPVVTPGHTPGCTTWKMRVTEAGRPLDVVFPCSVTVAGNKLVDNKGYPGIVDDFRRTFVQMRQLHADVVLTAHPDLADVMGRAQRRDAGDYNAFLAPGLLTELVDKAEAAFERELHAEGAED